MISINKNDAGQYEIKNAHYRCILDPAKGGTCRSLKYGTWDTGLIREGCEYWINKQEHFEQEFGGVVDFKITGKGKNVLSILVVAEIVSPQRARENLDASGGIAYTRWWFDGTPIIKTKSIIKPTLNALFCDKYLCFEPDKYTNYSKDGKELSEICKPKNDHIDRLWWIKELPRTWNKTLLFAGNKKFQICHTSDVKYPVLYRSCSMLEYKPEWTDGGMESMTWSFGAV